MCGIHPQKMFMWNTYVKGGSANTAGRRCCAVTKQTTAWKWMEGEILCQFTVFQYTTLEQSHKMSKSGSNEKFPQFAIQIKTAKCIHSVVCHHSNGHGHPHDSLWCSKHSHSLKQTMWYSHCYKIIYQNAITLNFNKLWNFIWKSLSSTMKISENV